MSKSEYVKFPIKTIIDNPERVIPEGYCCTEYSSVGGYECPFLQWRKMTSSRLKQLKREIDIPYGNRLLQYCSFLKAYLSIQDCLKDCQVNMGWSIDEEIDEILHEATSDGVDEELREKNDELLKKDIEEVKEKIKIKEKYELLAKYAEKHKEE